MTFSLILWISWWLDLLLLIVSVFGISALELDWTLGRGENTTGLIKIKKVDEVFMMRSDPHLLRKKRAVAES